MSPDNPLGLAIVLILSGTAVALVGVALMINIRAGYSKKDQMPELEEDLENAAIPAVDEDIEAGDEIMPADDSDPEMPGPENEEIMLKPSKPETESSSMLPDPLTGAIEAELPEGSAPDAISVTLARDATLQKLVIRIGNNSYHHPDELLHSPDWILVESISEELFRWLKTSPTHPSAPTPARSRPQPGKKSEPGTPASMVEEINLILKRKIEGLPLEKQAVQLNEALDGSVKMMIGVQSFSLDNIPDPEIEKFLRDAISEWESAK
jgi:hypothetical protein